MMKSKIYDQIRDFIKTNDRTIVYAHVLAPYLLKPMSNLNSRLFIATLFLCSTLFESCFQYFWLAEEFLAIPCHFIYKTQQAVWLPALLLPYCLYISRCSYHVLSAFALLKSFRPYIWLQIPSLVKIIQTTTFRVYLHKLQIAKVKSLILKQ